ncbi:winged helix-turn-helix domain-containing protein [Nocardia farcinica]|uniref:winged helix-turn-helix domain-containing protein n=1 Tax=Nocardia farcinica TaxID=37329 RepID=UPI002455F4A3|nr:winged helix-turn-helix domain-containing protein [Nocardia farcinica]
MTDQVAGTDTGKKSTKAAKASPTTVRARARLRAAEAAAEARRRAERIETLLAELFAAEDKGEESIQAAAKRRDEQIAEAEKRMKAAIDRAHERYERTVAKHFAPHRRVLAELKNDLGLSESEIAEMTGLKPTEVRKHVKSSTPTGDTPEPERPQAPAPAPTPSSPAAASPKVAAGNDGSSVSKTEAPPSEAAADSSVAPSLAS